MKPECQALRKFPQGVYIPSKNTTNDETSTNITTRNEHKRNCLRNNTDIKALLDIISLNQLHKHEEDQMERICAKVPQGTQHRDSSMQSNQLTFLENSKLPMSSRLTELAFSNNGNGQPVGLAAFVVSKPKFQALRKFAQGAYVPQTNVQRRKNIASNNKQCRKFLQNNTEVKRLLDMISLNHSIPEESDLH